MGTIHGFRSFEGLRDRAASIEVGGAAILVASLTDIEYGASAPREDPATEAVGRDQVTARIRGR
jgi:hypothetical protein